MNTENRLRLLETAIAELKAHNHMLHSTLATVSNDIAAIREQSTLNANDLGFLFKADDRIWRAIGEQYQDTEALKRITKKKDPLFFRFMDWLLGVKDEDESPETSY